MDDLSEIKVPAMFRLSLVVEAFNGARCNKWVMSRMQQIGALQADEPKTPNGRKSYLVRAERLRQHYPDVHQACVDHFIAKALERSA